MNAPETATATSSKSWLPTLVALATIGALAVVVLKGLVPAQEELRSMERKLAETETALKATKLSAEDERQQVAQLLKSKSDLSQENDKTQEQLRAAVRAKTEAMQELADARKELNSALGAEIAAGDVLITERNGELVVDVADRLLFDSGTSIVNDGGQVFLKQVAKSLKRLPRKQVFQVGGHTDSQRVISKEVRELYPTNWELSTARATQVTRFLQERGGIPGRQLVAAGYSQYQPATTNNTDTGRQKNRRIEIVLLRPKR